MRGQRVRKRSWEAGVSQRRGRGTDNGVDVMYRRDNRGSLAPSMGCRAPAIRGSHTLREGSGSNPRQLQIHRINSVIHAEKVWSHAELTDVPCHGGKADLGFVATLGLIELGRKERTQTRVSHSLCTVQTGPHHTFGIQTDFGARWASQQTRRGLERSLS